jgi:RHS repeat-associated protein
VVEHTLYDAYGKQTLYNGTWSATQLSTVYNNEVLYAGYRLDPESGLYQVRNRAYHPTLGRWVQRDPLGSVDGMDLYEYSASNAINNLDPFGLQVSPAAAAKCNTLYHGYTDMCEDRYAAGSPGRKCCMDAARMIFDRCMADASGISPTRGGESATQCLNDKLYDNATVPPLARALHAGGTAVVMAVQPPKTVRGGLKPLPGAGGKGTKPATTPGVRPSAPSSCGAAARKTTNVADAAKNLGTTSEQVRKAIHSIKAGLPRGGPVTNPDVEINVCNGDVTIKGTDELIGNIIDEIGNMPLP